VAPISAFADGPNLNFLRTELREELEELDETVEIDALRAERMELTRLREGLGVMPPTVASSACVLGSV
jgi:hypothetical protein